MDEEARHVVIIVLISEGWVPARQDNAAPHHLDRRGGEDPFRTFAPLSGIFRGPSLTRRYFGIQTATLPSVGIFRGIIQTGASKSEPRNCVDVGLFRFL